MKWFLKKKRGAEINIDEILLDSSNLPSFNTGRMEGRIEFPLTRRGMLSVGGVFVIIALVFLIQAFQLQVVAGSAFREQSENNVLDSNVVFAERGVVYDRNGERLIWNENDINDVNEFADRAYSNRKGLGQLLGYVNYPRKDSSGFYFRTEYIGRGGLEEALNERLQGDNGDRLVERDALGNVVSEHVVTPPEDGESITLSIDAELSEALYNQIATTTRRVGFRSGAGAIMDVETGEIIALASYPSFDPEVMTRGDDPALIDAYNNDERLPFLNKVISGVYTPGSIIKPFMALAVLAENIIDPRKIIVSTGSLIIPNPYNPDNPSVFTDWRAHGEVDLRRAIEVSSNVYFYYVGGGFQDQAGLGISKIHEYMRKFGFGSRTGIDVPGEVTGIVPNPEWKRDVFDDDWRLGDTYLTSIGQFGFQTTPLQVLVGYSAIANGGTLLTPTFVKGSIADSIDLNLDPNELRIIKEGMRQAVTSDTGTARALRRSDVAFAGKTGTAEIDSQKKFVNSWVAGFYPYDEPKYAFVLMMERGPRENLFGSSPAMSQFFTWVAANMPEYLLVSNEDQVDE